MSVIQIAWCSNLTKVTLAERCAREQIFNFFGIFCSVSSGKRKDFRDHLEIANLDFFIVLSNIWRYVTFRLGIFRQNSVKRWKDKGRMWKFVQ